MSIIIFCYNIDYHKEWSAQYELVKLVTKDFSEALTAAKTQLKKALAYQMD
jgi:hypothetical protein